MEEAIRGVAAVGGSKVVSLGITFIATVLTIRLITGAFGAEEYGAVSLIATLAALVPFADLGLGLAITNLTVRAVETRSGGSLRLSVSVVTWVLAAMGLLGVGITVVLSIAGAWSTILGPASNILGDPDRYMPWYAVLASVWLLSGPGFRLLVGLRRTNTVVFLQALGPVIAATATWVAVLGGAPLLAFAFFPLGGSIIAGSIAWILSARRLGAGMRSLVAPTRIRRSRRRTILRVGIGGMWFSVGGLLLFAVDRMLLSHLAGAEALAAYAVAVPLFSAAQSGLGSIGAYLWPQYTTLRLRGLLTRRRILRDWVLLSVAGVAVASALWVLFPLYAAITGQTEMPVSLVASFSLLILLQSVTLTLTSAFTNETEIRVQGLALFGAFLAKVALSLLFVPQWGAAGVVLSTALAVLLIQIPVLVRMLVRTEQRPSS